MRSSIVALLLAATALAVEASNVAQEHPMRFIKRSPAALRHYYAKRSGRSSAALHSKPQPNPDSSECIRRHKVSAVMTSSDSWQDLRSESDLVGDDDMQTFGNAL